MKRFGFSLCLLSVAYGSFFLYARGSDAVPAVNPAIPNQNIEISYGTFVKASPDGIVLSEYNAEKDANVDVAYVLDADTKLTNIESVDKIAPGADIELSYAMFNDKKMVKSLVVELPESAGVNK